MIDNSAHTTIDHATIRRWVEERGGRPAIVGSQVRLDFSPTPDRKAATDWQKFFNSFEDCGLALLYQRRTRDGHLSRFCRLVHR